MGSRAFWQENRRMRKQTFSVAAVLGLGLGLGLTVAACGADVSFADFADQQAEQSYDVPGKIAFLEARTGAGDIVVNESDRTGVHVTETLHWRGDRPKDGHAVNGDRLTLDYRCRSCAVDYKVEIPRGLEVKLDSGSGTFTLRGLTGPVAASTGSGDIDAQGLTGKRVTAGTGSGEVKLRFAAAPDLVKVETGAGDGLVWVPRGAYNVTTQTGAGNRTVEVTQDPSSQRTIVVKTGAGDAVVHGV
jgi:hypothetical protein